MRKIPGRLILLTIISAFLLLSGCQGTGRSVRDPFTEARNAAAAGRQPDFSGLRQQDSEICAWLYIPGLNISEPIRSDDEQGLFIQAEYNSSDFRDRLSVIYGAAAWDGSLFGRLQRAYSEDGSLSRFGEVFVYTPDQTLLYQVFGAGSFDNRHLLRSYGMFEIAEEVSRFISDLKNYHTMSNQFDDTAEPADTDRFLVLSCHAAQSEDQRFLVAARSVDRTA